MLQTLRKTPMMKLPTMNERIMRGDQAQHHVSRVAVLHAEKHDRGGAHVVLPAQHEKTRNGIKVSASTSSETELALRLSMSVQLCSTA